MVLEDMDSYVQKNETQSPTYTIHTNKFKVDKRLKYKSWHHKSTTENIGRKISDIPHSNIFTDLFPRVRGIKKRINKWVFIKMKSFCMAKENISKVKREPTIWENVFAHDISNKGFISKYMKNSHDSTSETQPNYKMGKGPEQTILQGGHREGPETYERMLSITSHQKDAN